MILDEPEHELGRKPDHVVPDLEIGPEGSPPYYDVAPDWVCEILSPRTEATDRGVKMRIHRRERVGHAWLVNPVTRTLEVYRLEAGRWVLLDRHEGDAVVRAEPFDAIELSIAVLWER